MGIYDEGDDDPYPQLNTSKHIDQAPVDTTALKIRMRANQKNEEAMHAQKLGAKNLESKGMAGLAEESFRRKSLSQMDSLDAARAGKLKAK